MSFLEAVWCEISNRSHWLSDAEQHASSVTQYLPCTSGSEAAQWPESSLPAGPLDRLLSSPAVRSAPGHAGSPMLCADVRQQPTGSRLPAGGPTGLQGAAQLRAATSEQLLAALAALGQALLLKRSLCQTLHRATR